MFTLERQWRCWWCVPAKERCGEACCEALLALALWKRLLHCAPEAMYRSIHTQAMHGADLCQAPWLLMSLNNSCSLFLWAKVKCCSIKHVGYSATEGVCNSSSCNCRHIVLAWAASACTWHSRGERKSHEVQIMVKRPKRTTVSIWSDLLRNAEDCYEKQYKLKSLEQRILTFQFPVLMHHNLKRKCSNDTYSHGLKHAVFSWFECDYFQLLGIVMLYLPQLGWRSCILM